MKKVKKNFLLPWYNFFFVKMKEFVRFSVMLPEVQIYFLHDLDAYRPDLEKKENPQVRFWSDDENNCKKVKHTLHENNWSDDE